MEYITSTGRIDSESNSITVRLINKLHHN